MSDPTNKFRDSRPYFRIETDSCYYFFNMLPLQRKPAALEILTMIVIEKNRKHLRLRHHHFLFQEFPSYLVFDLFTLDMQKPINTYKIWHFYYPYDQLHGLYSPTFTPTNNPASKVVCINTMCIYTILL